MLIGYEQRERKPGLHEISIPALKEEQVWEPAFPVAAAMEGLVARNLEAGVAEDMEGIVEAYMEMEVDLEASRATSRILEAVELRVEAVETDSRNTTNTTKGPLLHQGADK